MMIENLKSIKVNVDGVTKQYDTGSTYYDVAKDFQDMYSYPILLVKCGNEYHELFERIKPSANIEFVTLKDRRGNSVYVNSLVFLLSYTVSELFGKDAKIIVNYSIDKGLYIETNFTLNSKKCDLIKDAMLDNVRKNIPIVKCKVDRAEAIDYFKSKKDYSRIEILRYIAKDTITLYRLGNIYDYFFSKMVTSTCVLGMFDLHFLNDHGLVLLFPSLYYDGIKKYEHHPALFTVYSYYKKWADTMKISNVSDLNKIISSGRCDDIIRIEETIQSSRLLYIAKDIVDKKRDVKIILIAGPSSSGKTTTCKKLSMFLRIFGMEPREISMDDYFVDRDMTPKDENGENDFECLEAVNIKRFDKDVKKLLDGEEVLLPRYNFIRGVSEESEKKISLGKNDVLIIEGIHALSDKILKTIDNKRKFKIYISPLAVLSIDSHNRISTTDCRLIRRMVRDNRTRGYGPDKTLDAWKKVRLGEEKHIFPYQDAADVVFNTAFIYELSVLKTYVEPLLYSIDMDDPYYEEAIRLINLLGTVLPMTSDAVPSDSLLREFIGGSCFQ